MSGYHCNRKGNYESAQISEMGAIDISSANFTLANGAPFLVKNNNDEAVSVEIKPNDNDSFISTTIPAYSWEPVLVKEVKANSSLSNLQYGI